MRDNEEIGRSREAVELFKVKVVKFTCVVFQSQDKFAYSLEIDDLPNSIYFCIVPFF